MHIFEIGGSEPNTGLYGANPTLDHLIDMLGVAQQSNRGDSDVTWWHEAEATPLIRHRYCRRALAVALLRRVAPAVVATGSWLVAAVALEIVVVIALPIHQALVGKRENTGRECGYKVAVMRRYERRALVFGQTISQSNNRFEIEMIRRLIEDQHIVFGQHELGEYQPHSLAARERFGRFQTFLALEKHASKQPTNLLKIRIRVEKCSQSVTVIPSLMPSR